MHINPMKKLLYMICCWLPVAACQSQKADLPAYIKTESNAFMIDYAPQHLHRDFRISVDSILLPAPGMKSEPKPLISIKDNRMLVTAPKASVTFVIDLHTNTLIARYKTGEQGPEYVPVTANCSCPADLSVDIQSVDFYSGGNILLQYEGKLKVIDTAGNVADTFVLNSNNLKKDKFLYSNLFESPVHFDESTQKIAVFRYCYVCPYRTKKYYESSIGALVDAQTGNIEETDMHYPEIYTQFGLGFADIVYSSFYGGRQFITFYPDSRIYVYDMQAETTSVYPGRSAHSKGIVNTLTREDSKDQGKLLMHLMKMENYKQLVFDPSVNRYYRLFSTPKEVSVQNMSTVFESYFQVFDENFNLLGEIPVEDCSVYYTAYDGGVKWVELRNNAIMLYTMKFVESAP